MDTGSFIFCPFPNKNCSKSMTSPSINANPVKRLFNNKVVKWWIVGLGFMAINILMLDWFKQSLGWSLTISSVMSAEICTILRYGVNDLWVFGSPKLSWLRCWEYHVANFSSFFLWNFIIVVLGDKLQWDHRLAAVIATMVSVSWSMVTNFLWVWKQPSKKKKAAFKE